MVIYWDFIDVTKRWDLVRRDEAEATITKLSAELRRTKDRYSVHYNAGYEAGRIEARKEVIETLFGGRK